MSAGGNTTIGIIGAGVAGLLTARRLLEQGLSVELIERRSDVGGLWNRDQRYGGVYRSAHLISSKHSTELAEFPMPPEYPDFPNHAQVLAYLSAFAQQYGLTPHITFSRQVERAQPLAGGGWQVDLDDGQQRRYAALVIATGHHWDPYVPAVPDTGFDGVTMHSADYETPDVFAGRRVVVVGLGNTACDVAIDAVPTAADVVLSVRGGNQLVPKYLMGMPTDRLSKDGPTAKLTARLPERIRTAIESRLISKLAGAPENFGLPKPAHRLYERQPLVNSLLPYHLGHGNIRIKPPVTELRNSTVVFADGSEEKADVVVWCTGYRVSLPFVDVRADLNGDEHGRPQLWLNMFHPERDDVVVVGMVDALGSFTTLDLQAQLAAGQLRSVLAAGSGGPVFGPADRAPGELASAGGPDRDWLFKDRSYTALLRSGLERLGKRSR